MGSTANKPPASPTSAPLPPDLHFYTQNEGPRHGFPTPGLNIKDGHAGIPFVSSCPHFQRGMGTAPSPVPIRKPWGTPLGHQWVGDTGSAPSQPTNPAQVLLPTPPHSGFPCRPSSWKRINNGDCSFPLKEVILTLTFVEKCLKTTRRCQKKQSTNRKGIFKRA